MVAGFAYTYIYTKNVYHFQFDIQFFLWQDTLSTNLYGEDFLS